ncbi:MAG: cation-translocating P-type ATPase [Dehalococcoidia bacterium]
MEREETVQVEPLERRPWHTLDRADVEAHLGTGSEGLSSAEVKARLARYGPNRLEEAPPPSDLVILLHQFRSPLIYILLFATGLTLFLREFIDSMVIAAVLVLNAVIGFTQERQAEASVRALMKLVSPRARVIREGREWEVESAELVPGDVVLLESGSRVPADMRLVATTTLMIDESLLTGESVPVAKRSAPLEAPDIELADRVNMAYAGSVVTSGRGRGIVTETGNETQLGTIAASIREEAEPQTPLQQRLTGFAHIIGGVIGVSVVVAFIMGVMLGNSPTEMLKVAVALAVAAVPEGLPVVFTITLALGVRRMAHRNAIIRRLPAVETLGSTTVIGSDKTGTLTENRMTVQEIWAGGGCFALGDGAACSRPAALETADGMALVEHHPLYLTLLTGVLTNEAEIYSADGGYESRGDPTEAALLIAAARTGIEPEHARREYDPYADIPFEPERQYSASIRVRNGEYFVFVKGAPERVLQMSAQMMTDGGPAPLDSDAVQEAASNLAARGLRVLATAYRQLAHPPESAEDLPDPEGLVFLGLQGMKDPPRAGVGEAIAGCRDAGIRVLMITGDHVATARAIAKELNIAGDEAPALSGSELAAMDEETLRERAQEVSIYARAAPEHKLRVVRALRHRGEVVAVTGDGVNDAPALKAADIGIAMGKSGTDVAREASDMVLADDNFVSIYAAVEEGRVTFDNVRKVTFFLIATGAGSIITILAALLFQWPVPFLPAQLLWLNLVTNGLQDVALAFEPGERYVLKRPPRSRQEGIISSLLWERTALVGLVIAVGTLFLFRWELDQTGSLARAQTVALSTMVFFQIFHVGNSRSEFGSAFRKSPLSNPFLFVATVAALVVHISALYLPPTQYVLRVEPIELETWVRMALVASSVVAVVEVHKFLRRGKRPDLMARPALGHSG